MKGYVGKRINRVDALDKVLGKPLYATDLHMEGMLYLKVLHAPHPHALIKRSMSARPENCLGLSR